MADKQLIVAVEGTAAMGPFWQTIISDYLDKIIRSFCGNELSGQKPSASNAKLSVVMFNAHGSYSACLVQRSGWTRDVDIFFQWLSAIPFSGGGFSDAAIAEGLAEALMMFNNSNGSQSQQNMDGQKHCILIAASNPYPLPTPVYRPQFQKLEQSENIEMQTEGRLSDAETVARSFAQSSVYLSVICPKQLSKLKAIYNAGKRNPRGADVPVDSVKNPHYLVLISENFIEARAALNKTGMTNIQSNQSPVKGDLTSAPPQTGPVSTSITSGSGSTVSRLPNSMPNVPAATVKIEPTTITSVASGPAFPHITSVARAASQGIQSFQASSPMSVSQDTISTIENVQEMKPVVPGMPQPLRPGNPAPANVNILNNLSQARQVMTSATLTGGTSIGLQPIGGTLSNMISSGMASSVASAQNILSSGQSPITSVAVSGTIAGNNQVVQNPAPGSFTSSTTNTSGIANVGISQPLANLQGGISMGQSVPGISQGNLSVGSMVQNGVGVNTNMVSGMSQPGVSSGSGTMIPTPGIPQQVQPGTQPLGVNNNTAANIQLPQQTSSALQPAQSKYVRVWEGNLSGQRQGQPVLITRLEGYRSASASETLAANWPNTMQIVRLISQDHMNNKQYVGKADFLVFRAMNQHGFLGQLQEKKLCAVIQLPSQTLLLSVSDKACRLIGMLFPGDMVVFKPQISSQQQQQQHHQQLQPQQQHPQLQHQQLPQLQQLQQQLHQQQPIQQLQQQQTIQQLQQQQPLQQLQQQQPLQQIQQQQPLSQMQQPLSQMQQQQQQQSLSQMQQQQQQQSLSQMQQQQSLSQMQQQQSLSQQQQSLSQMQQQQSLSQMQQQQQIPHIQQQQQVPQLQQQSQQQPQMVGTGMGQSYVQGPSRSQLVSQGQVSSQGPPSMPGGGFLN